MKNIKNFMRAKAWIFTLLIGMIGLAGFGQTTSDLAQNSETIVTDIDVGELASVVNQSPVLVNVFIYESNGNKVNHYDNLKEAICLDEIVGVRKYLDDLKKLSPNDAES